MNCALREDAMAEQTFTILEYETALDGRRKEWLRTNLHAPLPLSYTAGVMRAAHLRNAHGVSYRVLAIIMGEYHGIYYSQQWWRRELLHAGLVERAPKGNQAYLRQLKVVA
jgi:hypothetical protein